MDKTCYTCNIRSDYWSSTTTGLLAVYCSPKCRDLTEGDINEEKLHVAKIRKDD